MEKVRAKTKQAHPSRPRLANQHQLALTAGIGAPHDGELQGFSIAPMTNSQGGNMRNMNPGLFSGSLAVAIACAAALWSPAGIAAGASGSRPGDASMTCQQIAMELQPYMQQMSPSLTALGQTAQEAKTKGEALNKEAAAESAVETAEARATMLDPTGLASKIVGQRQAERQKELWKRHEAEIKPLADKTKAQTEQVVKQAQPLQSDARLQRLMQLAQEKNCQ